MFFLTGFQTCFGFSNVSFIAVTAWNGTNNALSRLYIKTGSLMEVRRLPSFLTGFDVICILWVVKHRLILSVSPGR